MPQTKTTTFGRILKVSGAFTRRRNKIRRGVYRVIHKDIIQKSGDVTLKKFTKTQVRKEIKQNGNFHGYLCGNRVAPSHVADGWHLGVGINCDTIKEFETAVTQFEQSLNVYTPELGSYAHYYQIVDATERNAQLRRHHARKTKN